MAQFSYADYQNVVAQAEAKGEGVKVGYFKLKDDGDIAIARLNIGSTEELDFASVHTIGVGNKWLKVSCHNPLGAYTSECALCNAHAADPKGRISKAVKKVFIQMMVSYRDPNSATGYTAPIPVIWDRPAMFSRELANKLMIAGDLRNTLVLITRNGKAGDMQTTYSMDILPAEHPVFKPEMIPADFSAFKNFNIARHSYWEKSAEEINIFLATGQFPETNQANNAQIANTTAAMAHGVSSQQSAVSTNTPAFAPFTPTVTTPGTTVTPVTPVVNTGTDTAPPTTPTRNFTGFSF